MSQFPLTERRADMALRLLRERLAQLDQAPGAKLLPERVLAQELNVSRRVIRQALAMLEAEGLITRTPGRGTVLAQESTMNYEQNNLKQYTSPVELMDARFVLEPAIAALAAAHATSKDIDDMHTYIEKSSNACDHTTWECWDSALHSAIGQSTHNSLLMRFHDILNAARTQTAWGQLRKASLTTERQQLYTQQHAKIISAIEERNPKRAAETMREHLMTVKRTLIDQLDDT